MCLRTFHRYNSDHEPGEQQFLLAATIYAAAGFLRQLSFKLTALKTQRSWMLHTRQQSKTNADETKSHQQIHYTS